MQPNKVYDDVIEFIASSSPQNVIAFRPSDEAKARVADLIHREKVEGGLSEDEKSELDYYLQIEHLMRLAKARAHHYLLLFPGSRLCRDEVQAMPGGQVK